MTDLRRRTLFGIEQAWHLTGDLDYADVTLLESGSDRGQQTLYALQWAGEEVGLAISKSKTKTLGFGETEPVSINLQPWTFCLANFPRAPVQCWRYERNQWTRIFTPTLNWGAGEGVIFPTFETKVV